MEHPHFEDVAELVLDEDLNRQPRPAAFGESPMRWCRTMP